MGINEIVNKAVFLDRDGVLNTLVFNPNTHEYESPHEAEDLKLMPHALESLKKLSDSGYQLFVISNQPSYAKGKTTLEKIKSIHEKLKKLIREYGIIVTEYYYCYHHPNGIIPEYSGDCDCRKPKPFFIKKAKDEYNIDISKSWMIGDQDSDIECGKSAGTKTILILNDDSQKKRGYSMPDHSAKNLSESINIILK